MTSSVGTTRLESKQSSHSMLEEPSKQKSKSVSQKPATATKAGAPSVFSPKPALDLKSSHRVYQQYCAIAKGKPLATGSFGPCIVLTMHDPVSGWNLLAHIDDQTDLNSFDHCFSTYISKLGEGSKEEIVSRLQVGMIGGWKDFDSSKDYAKQLLEILKKLGISSNKIDMKHLLKKSKWPDEVLSGKRQLSAEEAIPYHYTGGCLKPNGEFQFFSQIWTKLDEESSKRVEKRLNEAEAAVRKKFEEDKKKNSALADSEPPIAFVPLIFEIVE